MNAATLFAPLAPYRERLTVFWLARTEQERRYLAVGGAVVLAALVYSLFIGPAIDGRAQLRKSLPELRQQAAQLQAMALEAGELARQAPPQVAPMTRASLDTSLAARSLKVESLTVAGENAKLQFKGAMFASLVGWIDAQRREQRVTVLEATITALDGQGQVDAVISLRQVGSDAAAR